MAQTPRDVLSRRWLDKFNVDSGARRVFLGLRPDQQEALRRMGGLGQSHPSGMLMLRIRRSFGYVDLDTLMASDDLDQRSRSPALRIPSTEMNEIQGKGSLGNVISGPQPLHASTASLGAPEHTQTGVTAAGEDLAGSAAVVMMGAVEQVLGQVHDAKVVHEMIEAIRVHCQKLMGSEAVPVGPPPLGPLPPLGPQQPGAADSQQTAPAQGAPAQQQLPPAPVASAAGLPQAAAAGSQQQGKPRGRSPAARSQSSEESGGECTRSRSEKRRQKWERKAAKKAAEPAAAAYPSNPTVCGRADFEHFKGSGKGSLGEPVAPPQLLNPKAAAEPGCSPPGWLAGRPGKKMSPQEIDAWVRDNYREMENAWQGNVTELARGMNCLWKGIKKGKSGGESTKYEYFNGKFHGWADADWAWVS